MSEITKVTKNGITFYGDATKHKCFDIDVASGTTVAIFYTDPFKDYILNDCQKCFPQVEKIELNLNYSSKFEIQNNLFPNVREVKVNSNSWTRYKNGKVLIYSEYRNTVCNTFCPKADEAVDLRNVEVIGENAFIGCESTRIVNSGRVKKCHKNAFKGSAIEKLQPESGMALVVGSIIVDIDHNAKEIIIPDKKAAITAIRDGVFFDGVKSIEVTKLQTLINIQDAIPDEAIVKLNENGLMSRESLAMWNKVSKIELSEKNPYYKSVDGILYTKDMAILIKCPTGFSGCFEIPEGVTTIASSAFAGSNITEVKMPSTMQVILPMAFRNCNKLKSVDFGSGIENIGVGPSEYIFDGCESLKEIVFPPQVKTIGEKAFSGCRLERICFNEGITQISDMAFEDVKVDTVSLPDSLQYIGKKNFGDVSNIELPSDNIPYGLASAVTTSFWRGDKIECYIKIKKKNKTIFLPRNINESDAKDIDSLLVIPSFREMYEDSMYDYGNEPSVKQDTAIAAYIENHTDSVRTYLRRTSKNIIKRLIDTNAENELITFIKLGIMTPKAIDDTYALAKKHNLTTVMAYILDAKNKSTEKKGDSFKL